MNSPQPKIYDETITVRLPQLPAGVSDGRSAFDRDAVPMSAVELMQMAGTLLIVSLIAALLLFYLASFGRLSAQGKIEQKLDQRLGAIREQIDRVDVDLQELTRYERVAQEAERLRLVTFDPAHTDLVARPSALEPAALQPTGWTPVAEDSGPSSR